jgi:predicted glycosyltransferase
VRIVVDINHPAHVHYFKNFIWEMKKRGHEVRITVTEKEITYRLLDLYSFDYTKLGTYGTSLLTKLLRIPIIHMRLFRNIKGFNPDILIGFGSIRAAHISRLLRRPCVSFEDTEHCTEQIIFYLPFVDAVCTPSCFKRNLGKKQVRFNGYMELASLHPNYFTPNPAVLNEIGLSLDDPFIVIRFVSWQASHDVGQHGIRDKVHLVRSLEPYGRILITSEGPLPSELEQYRIRISPEKLHDLLYYAALYIGEGATTASECAVLGTHAIYVNTLRLGYLDEEEEKYNLIYNFSNPHDTEKGVFDIAVKLMKDPDLRIKGKQKRQKLLEDKIDVTAFMIWFIENYPSSMKDLIVPEQFKSERTRI